MIESNGGGGRRSPTHLTVGASPFKQQAEGAAGGDQAGRAALLNLFRGEKALSYHWICCMRLVELFYSEWFRKRWISTHSDPEYD
jgi:hypothetical protein